MTVRDHDLLADVQKHFDGELDPQQGRTLREQLPQSEQATALHLALAAAESERADAAARRHARMEAAIFGGAAERAASSDDEEGEDEATDQQGGRRWPRERWRRVRLSRILIAVAALVAVGLAIIIGTRALRAPVDTMHGMRTKPAGLTLPADRAVRVAAYRVERGARGERSVQPVGEHIAPDTALAFAYDNDGEQRFDRLLLFAFDEKLTVYWFYPAHTDPGASPAAVPAKRGRGIELRDAVRHRFVRGALRVFAVFTSRRDLDVARVEALARRLRAEGRALASIERLPLEGIGQHVLSLRVR
ncbi:MAG: hypothetical protein KC503_14365 [Myxococcales bacterium]|nr:hypothetical protein [Myxococcales bacterium]